MIFQSDIVKEATSARIVEHIESEIIYGRLRKGDKLPTERKMAEDMSVSRATVREAVKALETMGILVSVQGSGNYITQTPETTVDRTLCALFALNDGTMENLLELRGILESQDAPFCCAIFLIPSLFSAARMAADPCHMSYGLHMRMLDVHVLHRGLHA